MTDVLLGQAYYLRFDAKLWRAQQPYAPLGTLYAASHLRAQGHAVGLFDAMLADSERDWDAALANARPALAVIYEDSFNYLSKMCLLRMRQAAQTMTDLARRRGIPVVISGSDATDRPDVYLDAGATAVILGEGEVTLGALVDALQRQQPLAGVDGIAWRDDQGQIRRSRPRPFVRNLDELPFPSWDLVDVERYRRLWRRRHGYHAMNVATTRGCPFHCNWCAKPIYGQRYAVRSATGVAEEIAWLKRDYAPDQLRIVDDVFGLQPAWIDRFADAVSRLGAGVPYTCLMRADQVGRDGVRGLVASGCRMVWMGAESGSQRILDAMEKGTRVDQIRDAARQLHDAGIGVGLFLQFGYPGESWEDVQATLELVRSIEPEDIGVSVSYPLPGTRFHERVRAELGEKQNWFDSDDLAMMYRATYEPEFYRTVHAVVHHEFRARRLSRELRPVLARPSRIRMTHLRHAAAWAFNRAARPLAERRLERLAADTRRAPAPHRLEPVLTRRAAAMPTRQES